MLPTPSNAGSLDPWGKRNQAGEWHPLADHCLDVAIVLRALLDIDNLNRLGIADARLKDRLAVIAFLHDLGKCNWGFQAKADPKAADTAGHGWEAVALLLDLYGTWPSGWRALLTEICEWFGGDENATAAMLLAAISHHGRPLSLHDYQQAGWDRRARRYWETRAGYDPLQALDALTLAVRRAFPAAFQRDAPVLDAIPTVQQRFAGLVMLADWIGSDTRYFPYRASADEDRAAFAREAAARALREIGLAPGISRQCNGFRAAFGFGPSPLQAALANGFAPNDAHRLILVESDTGSGKTEAALAWFLRLYSAGAVDGLYFALPTRVAARELYSRVFSATQAAFEPDARPCPVLLAVPGYVRADGQPVLPDPAGVLWDDSARDARREQVWSAERPKRFLAAPVAVGTIDQALLSALQVKHSLLRSVCLDRHLLVIDEVHASDPYMREVLRALLEGHGKRGGWALLLSATLGEAAAARFFGREMQPLDAALARPYPMVTTHGDAHAMPAARARCIEVTVAPTLTDDEAVLPPLIQALQEGARVLVVCNTVARANGLFGRVDSALRHHHPELLDALFALDGVRCPHHGRFAREDRERLDAAVTATLGKRSSRGARLIIGTQTLEQSLDIDADWLVTDLAPMDVLIQRFGRLHRHDGRERPAAFASPKVCVRVPAAELASFLRSDGTLRGPAGLGGVYADGRVLARTWDELAQRPVLRLPQEARALIELATHPQAWDALPRTWQAHGAHIEGKELADMRAALRSVLDDLPFGELHYADKSERVLTRLGRPTFDLPLATPMTSPFGASIQRVQIPAHWLPEGEIPEHVNATATAEGFRFQVGNRPFCYTRFGLEKDDA